MQGTYGSNGSCWEDEESADQCATACETGMSQMHDRYPEEAACDDGSAPSADDLTGAWEFTSITEQECDGASVTVERFYLGLAARSDSRVDGSGNVLVVVGRIEFDILFEFECTYGRDTLSCPEAEGDYGISASLEADFDGVRLDGELTLYLGDEHTCEPVVFPVLGGESN